MTDAGVTVIPSPDFSVVRVFNGLRQEPVAGAGSGADSIG